MNDSGGQPSLRRPPFFVRFTLAKFRIALIRVDRQLCDSVCVQHIASNVFAPSTQSAYQKCGNEKCRQPPFASCKPPQTGLPLLTANGTKYQILRGARN